MKSNASIFLAVIILATASVPLHAQTDLPAAASASSADEKQKATLEKHTKPILDALKLNDPAKEEKVRNGLAEFFTANTAWHQANDSKVKQLWNDFNHARSKKNKDAADKALAAIDDAYATFKPQHETLIRGLSSVLTRGQIETVEDVLTVNKVKVTYNVYLQIFPKLTDDQKAVVLKDLEAAREQAVDAGSMAEKSAFFKKYKIKIEEEYLTAQGYDPQQARKDFAAKQKAGAPKQADANDAGQ